jgi:drug/metabolite transporter (DMT)-like permease
VKPPSWKNEATLLFVIVVWGLNFPVVKAVLATMHPHALNAVRFVASAGVLGGLYAQQVRRTGRPFFEPLRRHFWAIAGLGLLEFVVYQLCFIIGLDRTAAGNAALIMASSPLWTALVGRLFGLEALNRGSWIGLFVVLAGAVVIVLGGGKEVDFSSETFVGNLFMLGAAVCWGSYTAFSRPVLRTVSAIGVTFLALLFGLPFLFGIALPYLGDVRWGAMTAWTWIALLFSGGISTGLAIALWNRAIHQVGASHTAVFGNLTPLAALLFSYVLLGEAITRVQVTGGALILGGLVWMRYTRREPAAEAEEAGPV